MSEDDEDIYDAVIHQRKKSGLYEDDCVTLKKTKEEVKVGKIKFCEVCKESEADRSTIDHKLVCRDCEKESREYFICPFCKEKDFDLPGLKTHYFKGYCSVYNSTDVFL